MRGPATPSRSSLSAPPSPAFARAWRLSAILVLGFASGLPLATGQAMQAWLTVDWRGPRHDRFFRPGRRAGLTFKFLGAADGPLRADRLAGRAGAAGWR